MHDPSCLVERGRTLWQASFAPVLLASAGDVSFHRFALLVGCVREHQEMFS